MIGQGLVPADHHPIADNISRPQLDELLDSVRTVVARAADGLPLHVDCLARIGQTKPA